ncbi:MAG: helix-turn-helix domain-containing protein [Pseudomonadota bacterium]
MSEPVRKSLSVLRYLSDHTGTSLTQASVAEHCHIPPATLSRMLSTFQEEGLVLRPSHRLIVPAFTLEEHGNLPPEHYRALMSMLAELTNVTRQSAEIVVIRGAELRWQEKIEHPDLSIAIKARRGFRRGVAELDCLSRVAGAVMGWDWLEASAGNCTFYSAGPERSGISSDAARDIIAATDLDDVHFDAGGNEQGVRRFVRVLRVPGGATLLVSIAEPALLRANFDDHAKANIDALNTHVGALEAQLLASEHT